MRSYLTVEHDNDIIERRFTVFEGLLVAKRLRNRCLWEVALNFIGNDEISFNKETADVTVFPYIFCYVTTLC